MIFSKQKNFISQVKALNRGEIVDTQLIWKAFQGPNSQQDISYFCLQLFEHVLNSQKKFYLQQNQERLYATLLCLELLKNKKPKSALTLQYCRNYIDKKGPSHGQSLMQFLFKSQRNTGIIQFFISRLVMAPLEINWNLNLIEQFQRELKQGFKYQNKIRAINMNRGYQMLKMQCFPKIKTVQTKILTFSYLCVIQHLRSNNCIIQKKQYEHLRNVIKFLLHVANSVQIASDYLLKILHLTNKFITFYGCNYPQELKQLIILVDRLRLFPGIIGQFGTQLFHMLIYELKIPGYAFRKRIRKDFPSLDIKQTIFINKEVYLITEHQNIYDRQEQYSLTMLRKLMILHGLKIANIENQDMTQILQFIESLNQQNTYIFYQKIMKIIQIVQKLDDVQKIRQILKNSVYKLYQQMRGQEDVAGKGKNQKSSVIDEQFRVFGNRVNQFGFFQYPKYQIISININDFISQDQSVLSMKRILKKHKADYPDQNYFKVKISILFHGDSQCFSKFLKKIVEYQQKTTIQQSKQFQIYYIPRHESSCRIGIAKFIASRDSWYRKFVFNIHFQKSLYPHLEVTKNNKQLFPFYIYSNNIQLYLKESAYTLPLRVYRCALTMLETGEVKIIYMIGFFSMGLFCEAKIIKMQKEKQKGKEERYQNKQLLQIVQEKIKKINVSTVSLQIECVEPISNNLRVKKQKNIRVEDLQICNIPCEYFMGRQPNPTSQYLQMSLLTETNGRIFHKQITRSDNFKETFDDLFICRTVRNIYIKSQDQKNGMKFIIDGVLYTGVAQIKIQPMSSINQIPVVLPIQIFFPFA